MRIHNWLMINGQNLKELNILLISGKTTAAYSVTLYITTTMCTIKLQHSYVTFTTKISFRTAKFYLYFSDFPYLQQEEVKEVMMMTSWKIDDLILLYCKSGSLVNYHYMHC